MTEPTQESLNEAAVLSGYTNWAKADQLASWAKRCIIAHARTLDKLLGREPVDPLLIEARELVINDGTDRTENQKAVIRAGDGTHGKVALALAGLKRGMTLASQAEPKPWTDEEIENLRRKTSSSGPTEFYIRTFRAHLKERGE